jgi:hypothetical protein
MRFVFVGGAWCGRVSAPGGRRRVVGASQDDLLLVRMSQSSVMSRFFLDLAEIE